MIEESNTRSQQAAINEEHFVDKIEQITIAANSADYLMEKLGTYITFICDAAQTHHVLLNPSFVSASLAVKVEEGIALAMDPALEIKSLAIPIIVEAEAKRYWNSIFH
jgi:predicted unusual protein kinase regulating ubiquinone biosynthesis (AarF/ABC1/UbiB family)